MFNHGNSSTSVTLCVGISHLEREKERESCGAGWELGAADGGKLGTWEKNKGSRVRNKWIPLSS